MGRAIASKPYTSATPANVYRMSLNVQSSQRMTANCLDPGTPFPTDLASRYEDMELQNEVKGPEPLAKSCCLTAFRYGR